MGMVFSCCKNETPEALRDDPRAALCAGGRIQVKKNDVEDPHAPLLMKSPNTPKSKENELIDKELDAYVQALSGDSDESPMDPKDWDKALED